MIRKLSNNVAIKDNFISLMIAQHKYSFEKNPNRGKIKDFKIKKYFITSSSMYHKILKLSSVCIPTKYVA